MRILTGLILATISNFLLGLFGFYITFNSFLSSYAPQLVLEVSLWDYLWAFLLKFLVICILTWIMHRVMAMLDNPKKRILFIFLLGSSLSIYNEIDLFWTQVSLTWSLFIILGESINWFITGYILSKFIRPCLLYTSPSPRDISGSRMPSSA